MKLECIHADTCLSCYWTGHHFPTVQIPVHPGMSLREIKDSIREELRAGAVGGTNTNARLLSAPFINPDEEKRANQITRAAYAAVNRLQPGRKGQRKFFTDIPACDLESEEHVFAFFLFREIND